MGKQLFRSWGIAIVPYPAIARGKSSACGAIPFAFFT
jgi:hypothetical protein